MLDYFSESPDERNNKCKIVEKARKEGVSFFLRNLFQLVWSYGWFNDIKYCSSFLNDSHQAVMNLNENEALKFKKPNSPVAPFVISSRTCTYMIYHFKQNNLEFLKKC